MIASDALRWNINNAGRTFRVRYFTESVGSVWDDDRTITASGNDLYISGAINKIDSTQGSEDQILIEQGRIRYDDSKLFVNGSIQTTSGARVFTIAISGLDRVYREIHAAIMPQYLGVDIYKKIYLRELQTGSLF